jgi:DNA-binding NtrC family response regulator
MSSRDGRGFFYMNCLPARLHGLRAELIGRNAEMAQLSEAVDNLRQGNGAVISIIGTAGTGKSRLVTGLPRN